MDKFIVSARKYRPQNFSTVVGQSHITTTLKNAIKNNQLAHAFYFADQGESEKQPVQESWAKQSIAKTETPPARLVINAIPAFLSMKERP